MQRDKGRGATRGMREKRDRQLRRPYVQPTRDQCTRQGAPPWRVLVRIAYASSYATSSSIFFSSTPFSSRSNPFPFTLPFVLLPLSCSPSLFLILPRSSHFHRYRAISLCFTLCSDFSPFSTTRIRYPRILSLRFHRRSSFFHTLTSVPTTLLISFLFALLHLWWQSPALRIIPSM